MSSVFLRLMDRFFSKGEDYRVIIAGHENSGKTTLLYLLKLGSIIKTIPTWGTNIETIKTSTSTGRTLKFTGWDIGAGCGNVFTMTRLYAGFSDAMIWVVDSTDRPRLSEDVQALTSILEDLEIRRSKFTTPPKNYCILM
jgi:GTPase SAR1 family protein